MVAKAHELRCRSVAAFCAFDGEPDLTRGLLALDQAGIQLALPVMESGAQAGMVMREWRPGAELTKHPFGIQEPRSGVPILLSEIDMVLMPLVGWDLQGNRLGMGAGNYDRLFETLVFADKPLRVGVAFSIQQVESVPADALDVHMHALISELGWTPFIKRNRGNPVCVTG